MCSCHVKKPHAFDRNLGFVVTGNLPVDLPVAAPIDMNNPGQYLGAVNAVLQSDVPNYRGILIPLMSAFNLVYLKEILHDYHDKILFYFLTFDFPSGSDTDHILKSNAETNQTSATNFTQAMQEYVTTELDHSTLLGQPHKNFNLVTPYDSPKRTWSSNYH